MATIERLAGQPRVRIIGIVVLLLAITFAYRSIVASPQIGADEEALKTVDALFTAITSKDTERLTDCEQRLHSQRESGTLPASAARRLDRLIQQARGGQWDASAHQLYDFMLAQRGLH